jgi:hypothetical protein
MNDAQQSNRPDDAAANQAAAPLSRHPWYRLHFSTWILAAVVLAVLTLIVVPGRFNNREAFVGGILFYEHGWPFVFLDRSLASSDARYLKEARDKEGLRWALHGDKFGCSDNGFADVGPPWLHGENWSFSGDIFVSLAGLALDLATALVIVATIALIYDRWARRRWQYSLRTLLGAGLLIAVVMGWWRQSINERNQDAQAATTLRDKGLDVYWRCDAPTWLRDLVGANHLRPFHHVVSVSVRIDEGGDYVDTSSVVDADLKRISNWSHLQQLFLDGAGITDAGLDNIKGLHELESLSLEGTQITDAGLENIHDLPRLVSIMLNRTKVTGAGLRFLHDLPCLDDLSLDNTQITDDSLHYLKTLPELRSVWLNDTKVTDAGLPHLKALAKLKRLYLNGTSVTDAGLRHLEGARQLERLDLNNGTKVKAEGVKRLQQALPNCSIEWRWHWDSPVAGKRQIPAPTREKGALDSDTK